MSSHSHTRAPGIVLAAVCMILVLAFGARAGFGLFLQPVSAEHGWGREIFSIAMAIQNLLWGVLAPFAGGIADRHGTARVVVGCAIAYVLGLVLMAYTSNPISLYLGSGFLVGLALSGTTFATLMAVIGRVAPVQERSTWLGIAAAAASFGQFLALPLAQYLISSVGWRGALLALAAMVTLIVPLAMLVRGKGAPAASGAGQSLGGALGEAAGERGFHLLFWGFFVCGFHLAMLTIHLPAYVVDNGLKAEHGMAALAVIGLANMVGSYACGWLGGRYSKKYLLSAIYALRAGSIAVLVGFPLSTFTLYFFAVTMGLMWLGTIPLTNGLVGQIFGMRYMSMLTGIVFFGHQIGSFVGVWLAGWLFDNTGSYNGALMISIALGIFAALINLPVNEKPLAERKMAGAAA